MTRLEKIKQEKMKYSEIMYPSGSKRRLLGDKGSPGAKKSTIELFNSYKVNEYNY